MFSFLSATLLVWPAILFAQNIPVPVPRPQIKAPTPTTLSPPSRPAWSVGSTCALDLKKLNVQFKILPQIKEEGGCSIAEPLEIGTLLDGVALTPPAVLDCPTALQFVRFTQDVIQKNAKAIMGSPIKTITQASAYVCRTRNGSSKLSEHAYGRAIDIGAFTTTSGKTIPVATLPMTQKVEAHFLNAVRAAACGPFKTVLGPGSDSDHEFHFHFDLAPRKGAAYCVTAAMK